QRKLRIGGVKNAENEHHQKAGQDEQKPRHKAAPQPMQQPAGIGRKLLRLRPRQQHAEIERMEKLRLAEPLLLLHKNPVHQRDLASRAAKAQKTDLQPDEKGLAKGNTARSAHIVNSLIMASDSDG